MGSVLKSYGQHIKAPAATVRHRLYETLSMIPPHAFEGELFGQRDAYFRVIDFNLLFTHG